MVVCVCVWGGGGGGGAAAKRKMVEGRKIKGWAGCLYCRTVRLIKPLIGHLL